jgi:hypothetical protein
MAERYNTPEKGTLDWHVPLNENFTKLDKHVEIRDTDANRGSYDPQAGAKFLATDTGAVYVGDGSQWTQIGSIADTSSSISDDSDIGGSMADGTVVAKPGELQSVIDAVSTDWRYAKGSFRNVKLVSGEDYRPSSPIVVRNGVVLDCNGARILPQGDHNGIETMRNTWVKRPYVNTSSVSGYSSTAVVISAKGSGKAGTPNPAWVTDAFLYGSIGEGIGLQFRGGDSPCSMQRATGHIQNFDVGLDFHSFGEDTSGQGDWSNGNRFRGAINSPRICIRMKSEGAEVSGNVVHAQVQPNDPTTEWIWYVDDDPRSDDRLDSLYNVRSNICFIHPWDVGKMTNSYHDDGDRRPPLWYLGRGQKERNVLYDLSGKFSNEFVVNNSDLPDRNGIFHGHGGQTTGATQFSQAPVYEPNADREVWHPESEN